MRRTWLTGLALMGVLLIWGTGILESAMAGFTPTPTPTETPTPSPTASPTATATPVPEVPPPPPPPPPPPTETPPPSPTATRWPTPTRGPSPTPWCFTATPEVPGVVVVKEVTPPTVSPGQDVRITIRVRNTGTAPVSHLVVEDTLPAFLQILAVRSTWGIPALSGQTVRVSVGTLEPGGEVTITVQARARPDAPTGSAIENIAVASYDGGRSIGRFPLPTPERPLCPLIPEAGRPSSTPTGAGMACGLILLTLAALALGAAAQERRLSKRGE